MAGGRGRESERADAAAAGSALARLAELGTRLSRPGTWRVEGGSNVPMHAKGVQTPKQKANIECPQFGYFGKVWDLLRPRQVSLSHVHTHARRCRQFQTH